MQQRTLGRTGMQVSEITLGGGGIGMVWGETTEEECIETVKQAVAAGFRAVKMVVTPHPVRHIDTPQVIDVMVARVAAVRESVGDEVDVAVDLHRRLSPAMAAIVVKELEPLRPLFAEEPFIAIKPVLTHRPSLPESCS